MVGGVRMVARSPEPSFGHKPLVLPGGFTVVITMRDKVIRHSSFLQFLNFYGAD